MTHRLLVSVSLLAVVAVLGTVWFFANWPSNFLDIRRPTDPGDFGQLLSAAQSIFAGLGLIGVVYTILRQHLDLQEQRKTTAVALELSTSAALFTYYNEKISSLRNAIKRDAANDPNLRARLRTQSVEENTAALHELLDKHKALRERMEQLNKTLSPPDTERYRPK